MTYCLIIYFGSLLVLCFSGLVIFDRLVEHERRAYPQDWERDGKPCHGIRGSSGAAWKQCSIKWIFSTAAWMRGDREALRLLVLYRCLCLAFHIGLLGGVLYRFL